MRKQLPRLLCWNWNCEEPHETLDVPGVGEGLEPGRTRTRGWRGWWGADVGQSCAPRYAHRAVFVAPPGVSATVRHRARPYFRGVVAPEVEPN